MSDQTPDTPPDPWKHVEPWQDCITGTPSDWRYDRDEVDTARAQVEAQHQEALKRAHVEFTREALARIRGERQAEIDILRAERDAEQNKAEVRGNMLRYIAFVTTGDENGDAQLGVDRLKAERDAAHQEIASHRLAALEAAALLATVQGENARLRAVDTHG